MIVDTYYNIYDIFRDNINNKEFNPKITWIVHCSKFTFISTNQVSPSHVC